MESLLDSLRFQSDFQIAMTATQAARVLAAKTELSTLDFQRLLRLGHLRQRFNDCSKPDDQNKEQDDDDHRHDEDHDPYECIKQIPPEFRLTDEEFRSIAWRRNYGLPLKDCPRLPAPHAPGHLLLPAHHTHQRPPNRHLIPTPRPDDPPASHVPRVRRHSWPFITISESFIDLYSQNGKIHYLHPDRPIIPDTGILS